MCPQLHRFFLLVGCVAAVAAGQTTQPTTRPEPKGPTADQVFNKMLRPAGGTAKPLQPSAPATDKTSGVGAVTPNAPALTVLREGTYLVDRTGRLTRAADGQQWEFAFDADGQALRDPPVILLPNLKLMLMEGAVASSQKDLRFRVTGMVTEYRGRNYLLLDKAVRVPDVADPLK